MSHAVKKIIPLFLFLGFIVLYIHNLSRSIYGGDVGDLVTAAYLGGVPHPPGYPLFTFLGYLLTRNPFLHQTPAFSVGLISALSSVAGLIVFYSFSKVLSQKAVAAIIATLILGFSFLFWFYAEIGEVFALNAFFALLLLYLAYMYRVKKGLMYLLLLLFSLGLSFTNHQTIVLIVPSLFLLIAHTMWYTIKRNPFVLIGMFLLFVLGCTPYIYVFWASSHHPIINWDSVHDFSSFLHLLLRRDYGTFQAGIFEQPAVLQRLVIGKTYFGDIITQITIPAFLLSLLGFVRLWKKEKIVSIAIALAFFLSGPIFVMYAGFPIAGSFYLGVYERFFLLSEVILLIPFASGLVFFSEKLASFLPKRHYSLLFQFVFLMIPLALLFYNFPKTNLASVSIGEAYAYDLLAPLPPHAVLVISGDTLVFNTWYVHLAKHYRPDILLYNIGGGMSVEEVSKKMQKVAADKKTDTLLSVLKDFNTTRPVFSTVMLQPAKGDKVVWVPYGLAYAMEVDKSTIPTNDVFFQKSQEIWGKIHVPTKQDLQNKALHNLTISDLPAAYSNALLATGTFLYTNYKDSTNALLYYKKASAADPTNAKVYGTLGIFYMGVGGQCHDVADNLAKAIDLYPFDKTSYFFLYNTYKDCAKKPEYAQDVKVEYERVFQSNFDKDMKNNSTNLTLQ